MHVAAWASPINPSAPIVAMQVYVDGGVAFTGSGSTVDTLVNVSAGNHEVVVKGWDSVGANTWTNVYVNASGGSSGGGVGGGTGGGTPGVAITSPANGANIGGSAHVQATGYSPNQVTTMQIYDNDRLVSQIPGTVVNTDIALAAGQHNLVVQAWDAAGNYYKAPVMVNAGGGAPAPDGDGPQVSVPGNAIVQRDIDQMPGWQDCGTCAGPNGNGPNVPYSMTQNVGNPSVDGKSAAFWIGGNTPWGSAIWWKQLGGNDSVTHFVYDLKFYIGDPHISQALEFDVNHSVGNLKFIYGTECDLRNGAGWRVWDTTNAHWMSTGVGCQVNANAWNHLTWELERVGNQTHFIAVILNGYRQVVDKYYYAKPSGVHEINTAFQMDGDEHMDNYQVWLDKVALYYW